MRFPFETVLGSLPAVASYIFHWVYQGLPHHFAHFQGILSGRRQAANTQETRKEQGPKDQLSLLIGVGMCNVWLETIGRIWKNWKGIYIYIATERCWIIDVSPSQQTGDPATSTLPISLGLPLRCSIAWRYPWIWSFKLRECQVNTANPLSGPVKGNNHSISLKKCWQFLSWAAYMSYTSHISSKLWIGKSMWKEALPEFCYFKLLLCERLQSHQVHQAGKKQTKTTVTFKKNNRKLHMKAVVSSSSGAWSQWGHHGSSQNLRWSNGWYLVIT